MGEKIKNLRLQRNWTQAQLAKKLGLNKSAISQYEVCFRLPSLQTITKFSHIFNVTTDYLLNLDHNNSEKIKLKGLTQSQINSILTVADEYRKANLKHVE